MSYISIKLLKTNNNQIHSQVVLDNLLNIKSFEHLEQIPEGLASQMFILQLVEVKGAVSKIVPRN
jgi:hypothetical protein